MYDTSRTMILILPMHYTYLTADTNMEISMIQ